MAAVDPSFEWLNPCFDRISVRISTSTTDWIERQQSGSWDYRREIRPRSGRGFRGVDADTRSQIGSVCSDLIDAQSQLDGGVYCSI